MSNAFDKASLVMLPHAYEEGKVYSLKPTDRSGDFTFSRGTDTATRVGEDGYIKKEYQNILLRSNEFDNSYWEKNNATLTSGQSGYDGSSDAFKVDFTGGTFSYIRRPETFSLPICTISFYFKAGTHNYIQILNSPSSNHYANFDISNGETGNKGSSIIDSNITDVGNGWYRCSMTADFSSQTIFFVWAVNSLTSAWADVASTSGNYYIQDAQLNQGLAAYPYLETTTAPVYGGLTDDMPRLDYSGGATCPSLLLEPSRSNLWYHSEYYSSLSNSNGPIFQYNDGISPEGLQNAVRVSATNIGASRVQPSITVDGSKLVWSLYAKHEGEDYSMRFNNYLGGTDTYGAEVTVTSTAVTFDGYASGYDDADYEVIGDGWFRFWLVITPAAGGQLFQWRVLQTGSVATSYLAYGMQVEQGSYPTSYIPTYGSSQTRAEDNLTSTPLSIDGLFGATSGSIFMEFTNPLQGLNNNWFSMTGAAAGAAAYMRVRSYWQMNIPQLTWNPSPNLGNTDGATKIAVKWGDGIAKLFIDGAEDAASTYTGGDINMNQTLTGINGGFDFAENNANFKNIMFFQTALSDSECIALTTV